MGAVDGEVLFAITDAISDGNSTACLEIIDKAVKSGRDVLSFANDLILHFRNILLAISTGSNSEALDYSPEYIERLYKQGEKVEFDYILELITDFSELCNRLKYSSSPRVLLEVACIKACNPVTSEGNGAIAQRLEALEKMLKNGVPTATAPVQVSQPAPEVKREQPKAVEKAVPEDVKRFIKEWDSFVKSIDVEMFKAILKDGVKAAYLSDYARCESMRNQLKTKMTEYFGKEFEFKIMLEGDYQKAHKETHGVEDNELRFKSPEEEFASKLGDMPVDFT
jgi:DNA polymerase III gamma/tau subunit